MGGRPVRKVDPLGTSHPSVVGRSEAKRSKCFDVPPGTLGLKDLVLRLLGELPSAENSYLVQVHISFLDSLHPTTTLGYRSNISDPP